MLRIESAFHELMHSRGTMEGDEGILGEAAAFAGVSKFPGRMKCALLSWMAFKDALTQAQAAREEKEHACSHRRTAAWQRRRDARSDAGGLRHRARCQLRRPRPALRNLGRR